MNQFGKVIETVSPPKGDQRKVEIYSFGDGFVKFPVRELSADYLISQVLGNRHEDEIPGLIISPTFGQAELEYYKPLEPGTPRHSGLYAGNDGKGNYSHRLTDEGLVRTYLLKNKEFIEELVADGWIYFPPFEQVSKEKLKELGESEFDTLYTGRVSLNDLTRIMDREGLPFTPQVTDLKELSSALGEVANKSYFVYKPKAGMSRTFFLMDVPHKEGNLVLKLTELDEFLPERERDKFNPLCRVASFDTSFSITTYDSRVPDWWTGEAGRRVSQLSNEYVDNMGLNNQVKLTENNSGLKVVLNSRGYGPQHKTVGTKELIEKALDVRSFVRKAITAEHHDHARYTGSKLDKRRKELGLKAKQPVQ